RESLALDELRKLQRQSPRRGDRWPEVMKRIGYVELTEGFPESLSIIYWQATMWQLAAFCDGETAASRLSRYWVPPAWSLPDRIEFSGPFASDDLNEWKMQLEALLDLRGAKRVVKIRRGK